MSEKKQPKPKPPWRVYRDLDRRLRAWSYWLQDQAPDRIGWGVYVGDTAAGLRVQQRNDSHADPVGREVAILSYSDADIWRTHSAVSDLPDLWQRMIALIYSAPGIQYQTIAEEVGIDRRVVATHVEQAFAQLDRALTVPHENAKNPRVDRIVTKALSRSGAEAARLNHSQKA